MQAGLEQLGTTQAFQGGSASAVWTSVNASASLSVVLLDPVLAVSISRLFTK
jgi:hypothetical protein